MNSAYTITTSKVFVIKIFFLTFTPDDSDVYLLSHIIFSQPKNILERLFTLYHQKVGNCCCKVIVDSSKIVVTIVFLFVFVLVRVL